MRSLALLVALLIAAACGDDGSALDASIDTGSDAGGLAPPNIPWLDLGSPVTLTPCPDGHREVTEGGVTTCDPYPEGGAAGCAAGEAHFPGEPGCRPVGDACPAGAFGPMPTGSPIVYVDDDAAAGGDGSSTRPFASLAEAGIGTLRTGAVVALAKGTYDGTLALAAGVRVVGACAAETLLTGTAAPVVSVVTVQTGGEPAVLQNLTISAAPQRAVQVVGDRGVELRGVVIDRARELAVVLGEGARASLVDVVVRDTQPGTGGTRGRGIEMQSGASLVASRLIVEQNREAGLSLVGPVTSAMLEDSAIRDTETMQSDGSAGHGITVVLGATLDASRVVVERNHSVGILLQHAGTTATLRDVVVRDTEGDDFGVGGRGIEANEGAQVVASRLDVEANRSMGVYAGSPGSSAQLEDAVVRGTRAEARGGGFGRGLAAETGARMDASRVVLSGNREAAVSAAGEGAVIALADVAIRDTESADGSGRSLNAQLGARIEGARILSERSRGAAVFAVQPATSIALEDVVIRELLPDDYFTARGLDAELGAELRITRGQVLVATEVGIFSIMNASIHLEDFEVRNVVAAACGSTACPERDYGHGVVAANGAITMTRFAIADALTCGALLANVPGFEGTTSLDLASGTVSGAEIGACVQVDGYDLARLSNAVEYRDNGANLESTTLPVPAPGVPLGP